MRTATTFVITAGSISKDIGFDKKDLHDDAAILVIADCDEIQADIAAYYVEDSEMCENVIEAPWEWEPWQEWLSDRHDIDTVMYRLDEATEIDLTE